jgi:hypothetical protein
VANGDEPGAGLGVQLDSLTVHFGDDPRTEDRESNGSYCHTLVLVAGHFPYADVSGDGS